MSKNNETKPTQTCPVTESIKGKFCRFFSKIFHCKRDSAKEAKEMREHLSEKQIDKTVKDSFPASDPPSTY